MESVVVSGLLRRYNVLRFLGGCGYVACSAKEEGLPMNIKTTPIFYWKGGLENITFSVCESEVKNKTVTKMLLHTH